MIFGDQGDDKTPAVGNIVDPFSNLPVTDDDDAVVTEEERFAVDSKDPDPVTDSVTEPVNEPSSGSGISDEQRRSTPTVTNQTTSNSNVTETRKVTTPGERIQK